MHQETFSWQVLEEADLELFEFQLDNDSDFEDTEGSCFDSMHCCYQNNDTTKTLTTWGSEEMCGEKGTQHTTSLNNSANGDIQYMSETDDSVTESADGYGSAMSSSAMLIQPWRPPSFSAVGRTNLGYGDYSSYCVASPSSDTQQTGSHSYHSYYSTTTSNGNSSPSPPPGADISLYRTELEFQELIASHTDPVGKFLKRSKLTAQEALKLNIQNQLLSAPRKPRTKYGKRKFVSAEERAIINKERNKVHARATRVRRKIFSEVQKVLSERDRSGEDCEKAGPHSDFTARKMPRIRSRSNSVTGDFEA